METVVEVIGHNKDVVTIAGADAGAEGIALMTDVTGFYDPEVTVLKKEYASRPGSVFLGYRFVERRVVFKVGITGSGAPGESWRERDSRWRRLWDHQKETAIRVTTDDSVRWLKVRLEKIEVDLNVDPHVQDWSEVVMEVVAYDPFWYAEDDVFEIVVANNGQEHKFSIPNANPTDLPVFPLFVLQGGGVWSLLEKSWVGGEPARWVDMPPLASDDRLVVDFDPGARQLQNTHRTNIWGKMNGVRFSQPVPPHTGRLDWGIKLSNSDNGLSRSAQLRLRRAFQRPWGW